MGIPLRVLIIEDSEDDVALLLRALRRGGYDPTFERVDTPGAMNNVLDQQTWDIVLSDYTMPHFSAPAALTLLRKMGLDIPFIIVSGSVGEDIAVAAMKTGVHDYLMKGNLARLNPAIARELREAANRRTRRKAEQTLRETEEYNKNILMSLPYAIMIFDHSRKVQYVNPVYLKDFNLREEAVIGKDLFEVLPFPSAQKERIRKDVESFLSGKPIDPQEVKINKRTFKYRLFYLLKDMAEAHKCGLIIRDVTAEKKLQQHLTQSEKLAGIGTMAAGIAHEINNPLFGIMGMAEAILDEEDPPLIKEYAKDIIKHSKNMSAIVKGLTMYSRSTEAEDTELIDLNEKLDDAIKLVRHSLEFDGIEVTKDYKAHKRIMIHSGELQQVFVNIIHNAAQAMNGTGRLLLTTKTDGDAVVIQTSDSGPGIPEDQIGRIFDPFFTTKDPGKGTGLGLNIVYRIVQKYNGKIGVESKEGKGATFTITFPNGE